MVKSLLKHGKYVRALPLWLSVIWKEQHLHKIQMP